MLSQTDLGVGNTIIINIGGRGGGSATSVPTNVTTIVGIVLKHYYYLFLLQSGTPSTSLPN